MSIGRTRESSLCLFAKVQSVGSLNKPRLMLGMVVPPSFDSHPNPYFPPKQLLLNGTRSFCRGNAGEYFATSWRGGTTFREQRCLS